MFLTVFWLRSGLESRHIIPEECTHSELVYSRCLLPLYPVRNPVNL